MLKKLRTGTLTLGLIGAMLVVPGVAGAQEADTPPAASQGKYQGIVMETITELLGVSQGDVISEVRTGGTIADLAVDNGSTGQAVVDALMAVVDERLSVALDEGKIDQVKADEIRAERLERFTALVFETHAGSDRVGQPGIGNHEVRQLLMDTVQTTLGVNQGQLVSHVRTGGTLAELADENGSSGPELEAALVQAVSDRLDQAVGEGDIDEERAGELLAKATERIADMVYKVHQPGNGR